jgi:hypothetical protein
VPEWPTGPTDLVLREHVDACADPLPTDAQPIEAGRYQAVAVEQDGRLVGGLTVDGVAIRFDSNLERAALSRVLASLAVTTSSSGTTTSTTGATTTTTR